MSTLRTINVIHPSGSTTNIVNDASGNVTVGNDLTVTGALVPSSSFKRNRIINGNMLIDQRNAGASVTPTVDPTYTLDRWQFSLSAASKFSAQQSSTAPAGFINSALITSLSAYSVPAGGYFMFNQPIEGLNVADLGWGTASAQTVTLSFWVRSSLTGTFGGAFQNSANSRSYPFSYTISVANTWEQKSVTVAGDTSGTWLTTNGVGVMVRFGLGVGSTYSNTAGAWAAGNYFAPTGATSVVGTNGATFYITGVQLEVGTKATPYEMQIYSDQLAQCQRYYEKSYDIGTVPGTITDNGTEFMFITYSSASTIISAGNKAFFKATKRIAPTTITLYSTATGTAGKIYDATAVADITGNTLGIGMSGFSWYGASTINEVGANFRTQWTATAEL